MKAKPPQLPGQIVLVLQGGGALGAYQAGVYEALSDAGIEPDWVIGTSIGAINGGLIAGNTVGQRLDRLRRFWKQVEQAPSPGNWSTLTQGIPGFFELRVSSLGGPQARVGLDRASYYDTEPLRRTLEQLLDPGLLEKGSKTRFTAGAVAVKSGEMKYFDTRDEALSVDHIMASGALPPAFPAVRINDEAYWDGGVFSNTPLEPVFDDTPRRSSIIFAVNVWQPSGEEPQSIWEVMGREKDIQYASRADSHIARQKQLHCMRHAIRELARQVPESKRNTASYRELASYGCGTTMHMVRLLAPTLDSEDFLKDIDFSPVGIRTRWEAGKRDANQILARAPWNDPVNPLEGVIVHELSARSNGIVQKT